MSEEIEDESQDAGVNESTEEVTHPSGAEGDGELIEELQVIPQVKAIAIACHEANRAYCLSLGDESQPSWEDAPIWQSNSAIDGVTYHLEHDTTPEQSHENWLAVKEAEGWVYGEVKDADAKTHPCMMPYAELPAEQKAKDYIFTAVVEQVGNIFDQNETVVSELQQKLVSVTDLVSDLKDAATGSSWVKVVKDLIANGNVTKEDIYSRLSVKEIDILEKS